jgi:predicted transcriptional regulator
MSGMCGNRPPMVAAQHRILVVLQLSPMTRQQLETRLLLHRTTVINALRALMQRNKVTRVPICTPANGAWPDRYALANNQTIAGDAP